MDVGAPCSASSCLVPCQRSPSSFTILVQKSSKCMIEIEPCHLPLPLELSLWPNATGRLRRLASSIFTGIPIKPQLQKKYILQKLGLCISNGITLHIHVAKLGNLVPPTHPHNKNYMPPPPGNCVGADSNNISVSSSLYSDFGDASSWWSHNAVTPQVSYFPANPPLDTTQTRFTTLV